MSSVSKVGINQFAGEGYDLWKFRVETQMTAHGLKEMLKDDEPKDATQRAVEKTFAKQGFACQNYVRRSLAVLKLSEGTLLMDHFRVFDQLIRQFK